MLENMFKPLYAFLLSLLLVSGSLSLANAQSSRIIDKIVSAVGGEVILLSDIESQLAYLKSQSGRAPEDARCMILENLLAQNLMLHQARLDSIPVSDEEVESQIGMRMDRILALMNNDYQQFEEYYGKTPAEVRAEMREPIKNQMLIERMQGQIISRVTITPSEVKSFFSRVPKDSLPYFNSEVELSEIIYYPKVNREQKEKAYVRIANLRKKIVEEGEDFAVIASTYSEDLGSARQGGDLGWQKRGTFVPEFESVAYNLEVGEISPVFESPFGYHFMQLLERRGNLIHTRHVLMIPKIEQNDLNLAIALLDSLRHKMTAEGSTLRFEAVLKDIGDQDQQSFHNGGRMMNPKTGDTFFEINELDPGLFFVIDTMTVGQISAPLQKTDPRGVVYYQMVKLQSRTKPHKASLKRDYARIQEAALQEKKGKIVEEWVDQHIFNTFVEIAPEYRSCPNLEPWIKAAGDTVEP
jgi:peptidyl-prolyl cis-trans isomerase SurA